MRGMFTGWLLLLSPIALADEDPPPPEEVPSEPPTEQTTFSLQIKASGQYVLNGTSLSRSALREVILSDTGRSGSWRIDTDPNAASYALSSVTDMLSREGVSDVVLTTTTTDPPEVIGSVVAPPPSIMVSPAAASVVPIADVRFGGSVSGLGPNKGLEYEFGVNRAAAGARAQLGENIEAVVLLDAAESRDETSTGFVVRPRDARVTFPLIPSAQLTAQVGVQPPIFGSQSWFNDDVDGFYTVSDTFQSVSVLAGIHSVRALGVSATASFQEDRGAISAMVSNTGDYAVTEDNNGKDSSVRLQYQVIDPVTVVLAGRYGPRIEDDSGSLRAADTAALIQTDTLDALVEGLIGSEDDGTTDQKQATFIGTNVAVGYSVPLPIDMLDTLRVAARLSYFDPSYQTTDADAWMRTGGGMLVRWSTIESTRLLSGIGYEVRIPMDATVPISHQALLETHVQF